MKINAKVDRFENGYAVFTSDYGEITLPREALPKKYEVGDNGVLRFDFTEKLEEIKNERTAKEVLNELLSDEKEG